MKVFGKTVLAGLVEQIIETAINAFSYSQRAQEFQDHLKKYKEQRVYSPNQIQQFEELYDNWQAASETAKMTLSSTSKEMLQEALNCLENSMDVGDLENNQGAIQEIKNALEQG